jgi:hypothetical protein
VVAANLFDHLRMDLKLAPLVRRLEDDRIVVDELERVDLGKMKLQLIANVENQDRAQCGENEAGGMISFISRARKHVGNGASENRSDNTEHDRPKDR